MSAWIDSSTTIKPCLTKHVKPYVPKGENVYRAGVRYRKKVYFEKARSGLQALFVRRLNEVLAKRQLSDNQLAKLIDPVNPASIQRSVSRVTGCTQDPTLEMVSRIVLALGVDPEALFKDDDVRQRTDPPPTLVKGSFRSAQNMPPRNTARRNSTKRQGN
jgi:hypothetical protein